MKLIVALLVSSFVFASAATLRKAEQVVVTATVPNICVGVQVNEWVRCNAYWSCDACAADPACGWCSETKRCLPGTETQCSCSGMCSPFNWLYKAVGCAQIGSGKLMNVAPDAKKLETPEYVEKVAPQVTFQPSPVVAVNGVAVAPVPTVQTVNTLVAAQPQQTTVTIAAPAVCTIQAMPEYNLCINLRDCHSCATNPNCGWYAASNTCLPGNQQACACGTACASCSAQTWFFSNSMCGAPTTNIAPDAVKMITPEIESIKPPVSFRPAPQLVVSVN